MRNVAFSAGLSPMYLSLLERDACGPPSDEKLESLAKVLEEPNPESVFALAGRVTPRVASIILRHPTQWGELLHACEHLGADDVAKLKETIVAGTPGTGKTQALLESVAANIQRVGAATRRAQLEQIVEAAEKEEKIHRISRGELARRRAEPKCSKRLEQRKTKKETQPTCHYKNRVVLAGLELTGRASEPKRRSDKSDRPRNKAPGEPAYRSGLYRAVASRSGLHRTVASKTSDKQTAKISSFRGVRNGASVTEA